MIGRATVFHIWDRMIEWQENSSETVPHFFLPGQFGFP